MGFLERRPASVLLQYRYKKKLGKPFQILVAATLLLMTILLGFGEIIPPSPLFPFPSMFRPAKDSFLTILFEIQHFLGGWGGRGYFGRPSY